MIASKNNYRVGIYTRISIEDGTNEESVSIDTQKKILTEYVTKQGWQIVKVYDVFDIKRCLSYSSV